MMTRTSILSLVLAAFVLAPGIVAADINEDPGEGEGEGGGDEEDPPPPVPGYWSKIYNKGDYIGSSGWGAGYTISGSLTATPKQTVNGKDKLTAKGSAKAYAKLNGGTYSLIEVRANGLTEARGRTDFSLTAYAAGAALYERSWESTTSTYTFMNRTPINWPKTFVDRSVTVNAGPIPVTFTIKATGNVKASLTGKISNVGIEADSRPGGNASVYGSLAIGGKYCEFGVCVGASAGVYGEVDLIEVAVPSEAAVWWSLAPSTPGVRLNYKLKSDLELSTLDGELGIFAEVSLGGTYRWDTVLFDWNGFDYAYSLIDIAGTHCLSGVCSIVEIPLPNPNPIPVPSAAGQ